MGFPVYGNFMLKVLNKNPEGSQGSIKAVAFDSDPQSPGMDIEPMQSVTSLYTRFSEGSAEVINPGLESYLKGLDGEKMETYKLIDDLQTILPELHSEHSPHVVFEQAAERERAESACISILALYKDRYDIFTQPQAPPVRMQEEQWIELQRLIAWIEPWPNRTSGPRLGVSGFSSVVGSCQQLRSQTTSESMQSWPQPQPCAADQLRFLRDVTELPGVVGHSGAWEVESRAPADATAHAAPGEGGAPAHGKRPGLASQVTGLHG